MLGAWLIEAKEKKLHEEMAEKITRNQKECLR
jgi:hypothetical protein